ncbi:hypothetical protein ACGFXC_10325 [Streptomyces sp. NPDC048507]|uniref:hypothetical protein n=1 Tax=Streptomyces sp. NPDC048507 TaxID=3365560 RepID=UPI0037169CE4
MEVDRKKYIDTDRDVTSLVAGQTRRMTVVVFHALMPFVVAAFAAGSLWLAVEQIKAMNGYLEASGLTGSAAWAVPVVVQLAVLAGESALLMNAVLRKWQIATGAITAMVLGYGAEIAAHIYNHARDGASGNEKQLITAMVLSAVLCGGGWALVALIMHKGKDIADEDALERREAAAAEAAKNDVVATLEANYAELRTEYAELAEDYDQRGLAFQQRVADMSRMEGELEELREENRRLLSLQPDPSAAPDPVLPHQAEGEDAGDAEEDATTRSGRPPKYTDAELLTGGVEVFREMGPPRSLNRFRQAMKDAGWTGSDERIKAVYERISANPLATTGD